MSKEKINSDKSKTPVFWRVEGALGINEDGKQYLSLKPQKFYGVREAPTGWWLMSQKAWDHLEEVVAEFDTEELFQKLKPALYWVKTEGKTKLAMPSMEEALQDFHARSGKGLNRLKAMASSLTADEVWKLEHGLSVVRVIEEAWTPGTLPRPLGLEF